MIKQLLTYFLIILAVFFTISGIYFINKSFKNKIAKDNSSVPEHFKSSDLVVLKELIFDFENENKSSNQTTSSENSYSGKKSIKLSPLHEFDAEIIQSFSEIPTLNELREIEISFKVWNKDKSDHSLWVMEIVGEDGKSLSWNAEELPNSFQKWDSCSIRFNVNKEFLKNFNRVKTYMWNKNRTTCFIDDIHINFLGLRQETVTDRFDNLNQSSFRDDFENDSSLEKTEILSEKFSHSGNRSSRMAGKNDISVRFCKTLNEVMNDTIRIVTASAWLYPLSENGQCTLVFEVRDSSDQRVYYDGKKTKDNSMKRATWQKLNAVFNIKPEDYKLFCKSDRLCIYVFNNSRSELYTDDFEISYGSNPDRRGLQTYVNMNTLESGAYKYDRNHPPFPPSILQHQDIHNNNSKYLINSDSIKYGELKPDQNMLTGNFTTRSKERNELLAISDNTIDIYHYCDEKMRFILGGSVAFFNNNSRSSKFLSGDFNGDGKDEMLITSDSFSTLYDFSMHSQNACSDNKLGIIMTVLWTGELISGNEKIISGNFTNTSRDELFVSQPDGFCMIKQFTGNSWIKLGSETLSPFIFGNNSSQICGRFFSISHETILSVYKENNQTHIALIDPDGGRLKLLNIPDNNMTENIFSYNDILIPIHTRGNVFDDILSVNKQWRFEIKNISIDDKGFYISSVPEFIGYNNDYNPKYYEFPRLVTGKFTKNETEILCVLRNCADKNFDGVTCKTYDSLPDLPNTIQLYYFSR